MTSQWAVYLCMPLSDPSTSWQRPESGKSGLVLATEHTGAFSDIIPTIQAYINHGRSHTEAIQLRRPQSPPDISSIFPGLTADQIIIARRESNKVEGTLYPHWEHIRRRKPPEGLPSPEAFWAGIKVVRKTNYITLDLRSAGRPQMPYQYWVPYTLGDMLHLIDLGTWKRGLTGYDGVSEEPARFQISTLMEEAFESSVIEGAVSTREAARRLLRENRAPATSDERMIVNNYRAMELICQWVEDDPGANEQFTLEQLLLLHRTVTEGTLANPKDAGRLRRKEVEVADSFNNTLFNAPISSSLPKRVERMLEFANGAAAPGSLDGYVHPIVRAMLLHFWLAHDHPFMDGNGRCARAMFYWCMLRHGYEIAKYISISSVMASAGRRRRYYESFLHAETDDFDATYFLMDQAEVLKLAMDVATLHVERKREQLRELERYVRTRLRCNVRQRALLAHALHNPGSRYTAQTHAASHGIKRPTAARDLSKLVEMGLLKEIKVGTYLEYFSDDLPAALRRLDES